MPQKETPIYKQITYWVKDYGSAGIPDQRAVQVFMDCETAESVSSLRSELMGVTRGNYKPESLDKLVGLNRKLKHTTYEEWAKAMLLWIASYKG